MTLRPGRPPAGSSIANAVLNPRHVSGKCLELPTFEPIVRSMGHGSLLEDTAVIDDLAALAALLGREHWRVEAVTVRLHVLRMAVSQP